MATNYSRDEITARYQKLPDTLKDALVDMKITDILYQIGRGAGITIEKMGFMTQEVGYLILGLKRPSEFVDALKERLEISDDKARAMASAINQQVFLPLREALHSTHQFDVSETAIQKGSAAIRKPALPLPAPQPIKPEIPLISRVPIREQMKSAVPPLPPPPPPTPRPALPTPPLLPPSPARAPAPLPPTPIKLERQTPEPAPPHSPTFTLNPKIAPINLKNPHTLLPPTPVPRPPLPTKNESPILTEMLAGPGSLSAKKLEIPQPPRTPMPAPSTPITPFAPPSPPIASVPSPLPMTKPAPPIPPAPAPAKPVPPVPPTLSPVRPTPPLPPISQLHPTTPPPMPPSPPPNTITIPKPPLAQPQQATTPPTPVPPKPKGPAPVVLEKKNALPRPERSAIYPSGFDPYREQVE